MTDKKRTTISVDKHRWKQFRNEVDNASAHINDFIKNYLDGKTFNDNEEIDQEIKNLENRIEELKKRQQSIQDEIESKKARIASLEERKEMNEQADENVMVFEANNPNDPEQSGGLKQHG